MSRADLERVREWATAKLSSDQEPIADGHLYIMVRKSVDAILDRMNSGRPLLVGSLREAPDQKTYLALAWSNDSRDIKR
jgi:hypothetical protein